MIKVLESLHKRKENSLCFDCREKGTPFINITIGTFVCTKCAGLLRELNFAIKGIAVSILKDKEVLFMEEMGNENAKKKWMAKFDDIKGRYPNSKDLLDVQEHLKEKYVSKRFYVSNTETFKDNSSETPSSKSCDIVKTSSISSTNNNSMLENDFKIESHGESPLKKPSMFKKCQSSQIVHPVDNATHVPLVRNSSDNMWNLPEQNNNKGSSVFDFNFCEKSFTNNDSANTTSNNTPVKTTPIISTNTTNQPTFTHDFTKTNKVMESVDNIYQHYNAQKKIDPLDKLFYQYNFSTGNHMRMNNNQPPMNSYQMPYYQQPRMYNNTSQLDSIYGINNKF